MQISKEQQSQMEQMAKKQGFKFAVLFGSRANGKPKQDSDLDVAVLDERKETYERYGELFNSFSDVFRGYNVDLRFIKGAEPVFLYNALVKGFFLAGNKNDYYNYKAFAYKNYIDSKPLFELKTKMLQKKQEQLKKKVKYD